MMILIKDILPILVIGIIFAGFYEIMLFISVRMNDKELKQSNIIKIRDTQYSKKGKNIA